MFELYSIPVLISMVAFILTTHITPGPTNIMLLSSALNFGYKKRISKSTGTNLIENLGKDLIKIGFSENSLILKAKVLNQLWDQVIRYLESIGSGILRFSDFKLTVLTLSFLNYLNSILDSLGKIMGLETIKEFKDVIEGIININQNINLIKK